MTPADRTELRQRIIERWGSIAEGARRCGYTRTQVSNWLNGSPAPDGALKKIELAIATVDEPDPLELEVTADIEAVKAGAEAAARLARRLL